MNRSSAPIVWSATVFVLLTFILHVASFARADAVYRFDDGGTFMWSVSALAVVFAVSVFLSLRRLRPPGWLAPVLGSALALFSVIGFSVGMARVRGILMQPSVDPTQRPRIFVEGTGEAMTNAVHGLMLASILLACGALGLALAARPAAGSPAARSRRLLPILVAVGSLAAVLVARALQEHGSGGAVIPPLAATIGIVALLSGARGLDDDPDGDRRNLLLESAACSIGSVVLATASAIHLHKSRIFSWVGGESVDDAQRMRIVGELLVVADTELAVGLLSATAVGLVGAVLLLPRLDAGGKPWPRLSLAAAALVALPCLVVPGYLSALEGETRERRVGKPGEAVFDRSIPPGILVVDLVPAAPGVPLSASATFTLADGTKLPWRSGELNTFEELTPGSTVTLHLTGPYRAPEIGPIVMPYDRGVRLNIAVLRKAGELVSSDSGNEPEKILHVDITDPQQFRLLWASGRLVHNVRECPRNPSSLAAAVLDGWKQYGSHRNDLDSHFDTAIVRHGASASLGELVEVATAIARTQREFKGMRVPAFTTFMRAVEPPARSADETESATRFAGFTGESATETETRAREALTRCEPFRCRLDSNGDPYGADLEQPCGRPMCSLATTVSLWLTLADALAAQGDAQGASNAFRTAILLDPRAQLPPGASELSRRAFELARKKPLPRLRWGAVTVNGRIPPQRVSEAFASREGFFRVCYEKALGSNPDLQGRVVFRVVFGVNGAGLPPMNAGSDVPDPGLVKCMMRAAGGLEIPPPEAGIVTTLVPLMLQPR